MASETNESKGDIAQAATMLPAMAKEFAATQAAPIDATILPAQGSAPVSLAPSLSRQLPRLSVDLRTSMGPAAAASGESKVGADLEILGVVGEGGMGRVFLARQHSLNRDVAVKTAKDESAKHIRAALLAEGVITGQLEHPAIVPVHALGLDEQGRPAMVMKRIEGVEWTRLANDPAHEVWEGWAGDEADRVPGHLQILSTVCNAVHYAHSRGIVHRDIKLDNILIGRFGDVYLADWGVAARVGEVQHRICGTPGSMAPEMVAGGVIDQRTDVYLLGAMLHEILTGSMRHAASSLAESFQLALASEPYTFGRDVSLELADLVNRACHADPAQRPASAKRFRDDVSQILEFRVAAALAADASARTATLERLLEKRDGSEDTDIERLIAEASFGFEKAFASWPGSPECIETQERLRMLIAHRRERQAALEQEARQRDPRTGARARAIALSLFALVGLIVTAWAASLGREPTPMELVAFPGVMYVGVFAWTIAARKQIVETAYFRRAMITVHVIVGSLALGRLMGVFVPIASEVHFQRDCMMLAAALAVGALAYESWLKWMAACFALAYLGCCVWTEYGLQIFGLASVASVLVGAGFQWADARSLLSEGRTRGVNPSREG